ncbi:helix-turn-helix domain-containing protein [Streptococcus suis]|uniref:helix-turn-helix domain-containing protein n=1 Tax=Streptococcus suis TaxID=1307 RepID=UPI0004006641|nr:helix-turn-helix transcriptional regulator [Streptococcus suis]
MTHLGQLIHMERTKRQESQETLAKAIGVSRQTVLNWEKGRTLPDSTSLVSIAQRYHLSFDQLIGLQVKAKKRRVWINYLILLILFSLGIFVGGNAMLLFPFLIVFLIQEFMLTKSL